MAEHAIYALEQFEAATNGKQVSRERIRTTIDSTSDAWDALSNSTWLSAPISEDELNLLFDDIDKQLLCLEPYEDKELYEVNIYTVLRTARQLAVSPHVKQKQAYGSLGEAIHDCKRSFSVKKNKYINICNIALFLVAVLTMALSYGMMHMPDKLPFIAGDNVELVLIGCWVIMAGFVFIASFLRSDSFYLALIIAAVSLYLMLIADSGIVKYFGEGYRIPLTAAVTTLTCSITLLRRIVSTHKQRKSVRRAKSSAVKQLKVLKQYALALEQGIMKADSLIKSNPFEGYESKKDSIFSSITASQDDAWAWLKAYYHDARTDVEAMCRKAHI